MTIRLRDGIARIGLCGATRVGLNGTTRAGLSASLFAGLGASFLLAGAGLLATSTAAMAQSYDAERARCNELASPESRAACIREVGAAQQAQQRGNLSSAGQNTYTANALRRCEPLPPAERDACRARVQGEGTVRGSVQDGGLYREYRQVVPVQPAPAGGAMPPASPAVVSPVQVTPTTPAAPGIAPAPVPQQIPPAMAPAPAPVAPVTPMRRAPQSGVVAPIPPAPSGSTR